MVSATSDELLARVDAAAVDSWSAVSGSVGVQLLAPRARWFRLARLTIRYWTTVAYHRTRCQIVVLLFETSARRQPLRRSKLLRLLVPAPDLEINEGDERLADLNEWLLTETRRRALVALLPANRFMAQSGDAA